MTTSSSQRAISPTLRKAIFREQIAPAEVDPHSDRNHQTDGKQPLAVIVVGQTGAGKTRLAPELRAAMQTLGREPAHFIADTYKTYHPHYAECVQTAPSEASQLASPDARFWLELACKTAAERRLDVLVESACRHPDDFCELACIFNRAGYSVRVAVLAVPEALSRLGLLVRYYRGLPEAQSRGLPLRLTPKKVHDDSYAGLADAAKFVDAASAVDRLAVVRRGNLVVHENQKVREETAQRWKIPTSAWKALEGERARALSEDEMATARKDIEHLKSLKEPNLDVQIREVEALLSPLGILNGVQFPKAVPLDAMKFVGDDL